MFTVNVHCIPVDVVRPTRIQSLTLRHQLLCLKWNREHYQWSVDGAWLDDYVSRSFRLPVEFVYGGDSLSAEVCANWLQLQNDVGSVLLKIAKTTSETAVCFNRTYIHTPCFRPFCTTLHSPYFQRVTLST